MKKIFICLFTFVLLLSGCSMPQNIHEDEKINAEYIKACWITYFELEKFTSNNSTADDFEADIKSAFEKLKDIGINTVTVQVRPCADAFYKSSYFPLSKYCFGIQGSEMLYDPLEILVSVAHELNLRIEAWINPYRISQNDKTEELSADNIAIKWLNDEEKSSNVYVNDKIYFNPASKDVTELIVNGVKEIVQNYHVDAIHFDDYFYPSSDNAIDEKEYNDYLNNNGEASLEDFRRECVSDMVKQVYAAIKAIDKEVLFGISPQSNISVNYNKLYADVEKWVSEEGYVDYICPQIYFGFHNQVQPFTKTVKQWCEITQFCSLYIGLPLYKAGSEDEFASASKDYAINEFVENHDIISRQISFIYQLEEINGFNIFSYSYLTDENNSNVMEEVENIKKVI